MTTVHDRESVRAFTHHTHAACPARRAGPLSGLECGIKDIYDIEGHRTGFGNPDWLASHGPAERSATAVLRLLDAGAEVTGKTHTDEMAWSLFGENAHYGTPVNVNAPGRIPGGSSSGSAAAVAAGLVDFALGSDTGGSVRFPASLCGVFGMRPSHGRIPLDGVCPLAPSYDTVGWFTRDAATLERVGRVLLGDEGPAPGVGDVLIARDAFEWVGNEIENALAPAVARIEASLGTARRLSLEGEGFAEWSEAFRNLQAAEAWEQHGAWVESVHPRFGPGVRERFEYARTVEPGTVLAARQLRERLSERMASLLKGNAVLIMPTAPGIAPPVNSPAGPMNVYRAKCIGLLSVAGHARLPQINLPLVTMDGCPLGISLLAARGNDLLLLEAARAVSA